MPQSRKSRRFGSRYVGCTKVVQGSRTSARGQGEIKEEHALTVRVVTSAPVSDIPPHSTRIASTGWRSVWIFRVSMPVFVVVVIAQAWALYGSSWTTANGLLSLAVEAAVLLPIWITIESIHLRWLVVSADDVTFGYLFTKVRVPRSELVKLSIRAPGNKEVGFQQVGAVGLARRIHWVTEDQARAIVGAAN